MESLHFFELHFIKILQQIRTPVLDEIFKFINLFDTGYFIFFLIPIVWMRNWKWGVRLLYILFLNFYFNDFFKTIFHQPRPFDLDPTVAVIHVKGFGLPSGAAQSAMLYLGLLVIYWKNKKWAWIFGLNILFWMSLSRVYLGVHFFSDLLGGYVVGVFLILIFYYLFPKIEMYLKTAKNYQILLLSFAFSSVMLLTLHTSIEKAISIGSLSITAGLILSKKFNAFLLPPFNLLEEFLRTIFAWFGIGVIVLVGAFRFEKMHDYNALIAMILLGFWLSFFASFFWKKSFGKLKIFKH
jgi:membrane-associated phospholipid phosphatase